MKTNGSWILILLPAALMSASAAQAETVLGVRGGATYATIDVEDHYPGVEYSNRDGFMAGVSAGMSLNEWLWLRVEPSFVQKGSEVDWPAGAPAPFVDLDNTFKTDYVMIPVNAKAVVGSAAVRPFGVAGLGFGIVVDKETELENGQPYPEPDMNSVDLTLDVGAGVDIRAGSRVIVVLEGRYSFGILDIAAENETSATHTRTWQIVGGMDFALKRGQ